MKILERLIPILVMSVIFTLGVITGATFQKEKYVPCNDIYLDSKQYCNKCKVWQYGDTIKYIDRNNNIKLYLVK